MCNTMITKENVSFDWFGSEEDQHDSAPKSYPISKPHWVPVIINTSSYWYLFNTAISYTLQFEHFLCGYVQIKHIEHRNVVEVSSMIGFPLVMADSERDKPGIEPGPLGWHTSALTNELQEVRQ